MTIRPLLPCLLAATLFSCASSTPTPQSPSPTSDSPYDSLFNTRYQTLIPLYLFQSTTEPNYTYLGVNRIAQSDLTILPETVEEKFLHQTFDHYQLLAVIPPGSTITIEAATHEVQLISNQSVSLLGTLTTPSNQTYPNILFEFIQTTHPDSLPNPTLSPEIAAPL